MHFAGLVCFSLGTMVASFGKPLSRQTREYAFVFFEGAGCGHPCKCIAFWCVEPMFTVAAASLACGFEFGS